MKTDIDPLASDLVKALQAKSALFCSVESATGGLIADRVTNIPGASDVLWGAIVAYQNEAKTALADVSPALIERHGPVSAEVAEAMAEGGLRRVTKSRPGVQAICIATTGLAGPGGGTSERPVGLCHIAIASTNDKTRSVKIIAPQGLHRIQNKEAFAREALRLALQTVA